MASPPFGDRGAFDGINTPKELLIILPSDEAEERPYVFVDGEGVDWNLARMADFGKCLHEVLVSGGSS